VRGFKNEAVPRAVIEAIIESAKRAPLPMNRTPFVRIARETTSSCDLPASLTKLEKAEADYSLTIFFRAVSLRPLAISIVQEEQYTDSRV
jgi:hypothetical protein